jgi:2-C-methyl-D-erythritol 4-phosphate cytidylyltransferase
MINLTIQQLNNLFAMNLPQYALIVAGGSGSRMKSEIPKQFLHLAGIPIIIHTLTRFIDYSKELKLILVLPENEIKSWEPLALKHNFKTSLTIVKGGVSRFQSVKNGLNAIQEPEALVSIHDGVRPFIKKEIIEESFRIAEIHGNAITSVPLKDSIRLVIREKSNALDRANFRLIQTPGTFKLSIIKKAYQSNEIPSFTDDASVAENIGVDIKLIDGSYENIKITSPEDLIWGEAILKKDIRR